MPMKGRRAELPKDPSSAMRTWSHTIGSVWLTDQAAGAIVPQRHLHDLTAVVTGSSQYSLAHQRRIEQLDRFRLSSKRWRGRCLGERPFEIASKNAVLTLATRPEAVETFDHVSISKI